MCFITIVHWIWNFYKFYIYLKDKILILFYYLKRGKIMAHPKKLNKGEKVVDQGNYNACDFEPARIDTEEHIDTLDGPKVVERSHTVVGYNPFDGEPIIRTKERTRSLSWTDVM
jgi:hypothetical protein